MNNKTITVRVPRWKESKYDDWKEAAKVECIDGNTSRNAWIIKHLDKQAKRVLKRAKK